MPRKRHDEDKPGASGPPALEAILIAITQVQTRLAQIELILQSAGRRPVTTGSSDSPHLTMAEAARYLRFDATSRTPERACRRWIREQGIPVKRRGRVLLVEQRILDAYLDGKHRPRGGTRNQRP